MTTPELHGLDVHGKYQLLAEPHLVPQFALMSVKATEGESFTQEKAKVYFEWFRERRFRYRGMYHWIRSDSSAAAQVANLERFVNALGGLQQGEFVQLDWERTPNIPDCSIALVEEWLRLADHLWPGRVIVYSSDWVPGFKLWRGRHIDYPLWYANYSTGTLSTGNGWDECAQYRADAWQYSSALQIPGIVGRCCGDHIFSFIDFDHLCGYPPPVTVPKPPPITEELPMLIYQKAGKAAQWLSDGKSRVHLINEGQALHTAERYGLKGLVLLDATTNLASIGDVVGVDPGDI